MQYSAHFAAWIRELGDGQWLGYQNLDGVRGLENVQSAMRYVESADPFSKTRINTMLASGAKALQVKSE
jgi:hypothetical protein